MALLVDQALVERSRTFDFVALWFHWTELYLSELSVKRKLGYGYRAGLFYPNGARKSTCHQDWPAFYDVLSGMNLPYISIHALFCYENYTSCKVFIDSRGIRFHRP